MRLAVFTSSYPAQTATFFERDMRGLLEAGVEIDVFAIRPEQPGMWKYSLSLVAQGQLPRERVHYHDWTRTLINAAPVLTRQLGTALGDARRVLLSAARYGIVPLAKTAYTLPQAWAWAAHHGADYDHVLAYWGNYAGTCAYAFHRLMPRRVPFSLWLHAGTDLYRTPAFMDQKLAYADNVITCCEFNSGYILGKFGPRVRNLASKLEVCHHGLDMAEFAYQPQGRPPRTVTAVGRLAPYKGFDYLLRAVQLLRAWGEPDVAVELVGDGPSRRDLANLARELGIDDIVRFRGWLPFPEARAAMSVATVLVHPSDGLGDGLPNVIRESMALGTPVIASNVAGIPDAIGGGCGVLVPPQNPAALAKAIAAVLNDPAGRLAMADKARRRVEEHYDMWRNGARLAKRFLASHRSVATQDADSDRRQAAPLRSAPQRELEA